MRLLAQCATDYQLVLSTLVPMGGIGFIIGLLLARRPR